MEAYSDQIATKPKDKKQFIKNTKTNLDSQQISTTKKVRNIEV